VACRSLAELESHSTYRELGREIRLVLETPEIGDFRRAAAPARPRYRFVTWNIERGTHFDAQLEALKTHEYLREADVLLLIEADLGMARSGNRAVSREIARELGMEHAFAPCYLSLVKGSGIEYHMEGENELGLHGNAVLSRYPIRNVRRISLANGTDKMSRREKRLGSQTAVAAEIDFPNLPLTAVSVHLDAQSTQAHRAAQMRQVLEAVGDAPRVVLGGDWNTSTYNSSSAFRAILGFWLRVMMRVNYVIPNHYLRPYTWFEKGLFTMLEEAGFEYRLSNRIGERTTSYDITDPKATGNLGEWVPEWCFPFIRWSLRNHGGVCPFKLDWFATRGLRCENPVVLHEFREGRQPPLSDHDPVGVDILA
jgi:endonuclease/exonuclease/phosphatase family metal-dependent hydrolase